MQFCWKYQYCYCHCFWLTFGFDRLLFSLFFWDFNVLVTNILMQFLLWNLDLTWKKKLTPPPPKWTFHTCNILNVLEKVIGIISDVIWCKNKSSFPKVCFRKKTIYFVKFYLNSGYVFFSTYKKRAWKWITLNIL